MEKKDLHIELAQVEGHVISTRNGFFALFVILVVFLGSLLLLPLSIGLLAHSHPVPFLMLLLVDLFLFIGSLIALKGLKVVAPNEAIVFTLFGKYYGTIRSNGYYFVNPFANECCVQKEGGKPSSIVKTVASDGTTSQQIVSNSDKKISLKMMTLANQRQKVNDSLGNPIIIGAVVIWRVMDPTKAVFAVDNFYTYLSMQCDSTIRNIARKYPYDLFSEDDDNSADDEKTLRGSSQEIAGNMRDELQNRVSQAGLFIEEVRITDLSYAEEIAAAMLQRQQAVAIIAARRKIVDGAVGMVQMAIEELSHDETIVLDDERKASMISNLLVVLCGNRDAQPIVNTGTIY